METDKKINYDPLFAGKLIWQAFFKTSKNNSLKNKLFKTYLYTLNLLNYTLEYKKNQYDKKCKKKYWLSLVKKIISKQ